jgi:transposase
VTQRRAQEDTREVPQLSATRAGIEGIISQGVRTLGMRRSRSIGLAKTHLQYVATAAAFHLVRRLAWFRGLPRAQTRRSACARLSEAT